MTMADERPSTVAVDTARVGRRAGLLTAARLGAQALAFVWFLVGARLMSRSDFGVVGVGLTIAMVASAVGDLGVSRSIVRHVALEPRSMWPGFLAGLRWRLVGGIGIGIVLVAVSPLLGSESSWWVVPLAAAISLASGVTDLAYSALRSVGAFGVEATLLVGERVAFLTLAVAALEAGGGPATVLLAYLTTNALSASIATIAVARRGRPLATGIATPPMMDTEARRTAAIFTVTSLSPRLGSLLLIIWSSAAAVGGYVVAQRPAEVALVLVATVLAVAHPDLRRAHAGDAPATASTRAASICLGLLAAAGPTVALLVAAPTDVLAILGGRGRFADMAMPMRVVGVTILVSLLRSCLEILLLAQERAGVAVRATIVGVVVAIGVGAPLVITHGPLGAALAVLVGELVAMLLMCGAERSMVVTLARGAVAAVLPGLVCLVVLLVERHGLDLDGAVPIGTALVISMWGVAVAWRFLGGALTSSSGRPMGVR